jgi:calcium-dependent protein kinase
MLCSGLLPFTGNTDDEIFNKIEVGKYKMGHKRFERISDSAKDLLSRMLEYDHEKRISARQALSHPWILSHKTNDSNLYFSNEFESIKNFCIMNKFKKHITTYIAHNLVTAEEVEKLK